MYNVAFIEDDKCVADKGCRLCILYCPEADCVRLDIGKMKAFVVIDRCKGCELCAVVCNAAKHEAILMAPVNAATGEVVLTAKKTESAGLGQAYQ